MRKLVSLRVIGGISSIPNSDFVEVAHIDGWDVVVKKGVFSPGNLCVYFEIDSLLPDTPHFAFLKSSSWVPSLKKYRLRTIKIRGIISQGLALPLSTFSDLNIDWDSYKV